MLRKYKLTLIHDFSLSLFISNPIYDICLRKNIIQKSLIILTYKSNSCLSVPFPIFRSLSIVTLNKVYKSLTWTVFVIWSHNFRSFENSKSSLPLTPNIEIKAFVPFLIEPKGIFFSHDFNIFMLPHRFSYIFNLNILKQLISSDVLFNFLKFLLFVGFGRFSVNTKLFEKIIDMKINCVEISWFIRTLKDNSIHLTKVLSVFCHQNVNIFGNKHWHSILFCSSFKPTCHIYTGAEITCIDLEF